MQKRTEIIQKVLDDLWHSSASLMTLSMAGQEKQAKRLCAIAGQLQAIQADVSMAEYRSKTGRRKGQ